MADWKGYSRNANIGKLNEALEAHYDKIVLMVEILPLLRARFIARKLFSSDRLKEVLADCKSEKDKTLAVLERLPRTKEALYTFVDILKEDYPHVAEPLKQELDAACAGPSLPPPVPVSESDDNKKLVEHSQPDSASDDTEVKVPYTAPCPDGLVSVHLTELQRMINTQVQQFSAALAAEQKKTQKQENRKLWSEFQKLKKENEEGKQLQETTEKRWNEASKMIQELQVKYAALQGECAALKGECAALKGECAALKGECAKYKETISQQATTISRQEDTICKQNNRISKLEADRVRLYQYQNSCCARTFRCFFPRQADNDYIIVPTNANELADNNNQ